MKRTSIFAAVIGAAAVVGFGGTALAATDSSPAVSPSASPSATARSGFGGAVSASDAEALALVATGGGRVIRVKAETEHRNAVWSVRVVADGVRYDVDVDRSTGAVLSHGQGADDGVAGNRRGSDDKGGQRATAAGRAEPGDDKGRH